MFDQIFVLVLAIEQRNPSQIEQEHENDYEKKTAPGALNTCPAEAGPSERGLSFPIPRDSMRFDRRVGQPRDIRQLQETPRVPTGVPENI